MKTEEEIKEKLSEMRECLKNEKCLVGEIYGFIQALEWVLED